MTTLTQKQVKENISKIFEIIKMGEDVLVTEDHNQKNIAVIVPYKKYWLKKDRPLGILKGKASFKMKDDFKITDEELLSL